MWDMNAYFLRSHGGTINGRRDHNCHHNAATRTLPFQLDHASGDTFHIEQEPWGKMTSVPKWAI